MTTTTTKTTNQSKKGADNMTTKTVKRLKKYRVDAGMTIYSLADKLGVSFSSVSYWENGYKKPRHEKIMELEDIFGVGYRELFSDLSEDEVKELEQRTN